LPSHQLAFDNEKRQADGPVQQAETRSPGFICLDPKRMVNAKRSGCQARLLPGKIGLDVSQKAVGFRFAGKAFARSGDSGIQDQRTRKIAASLAELAEGPTGLTDTKSTSAKPDQNHGGMNPSSDFFIFVRPGRGNSLRFGRRSGVKSPCLNKACNQKQINVKLQHL
jgi:hypothetical protein